jgi:protein-disulfide isomerase
MYCRYKSTRQLTPRLTRDLAMRLAAVLALAALALAGCQKPAQQAASDEMTMGNPKAPVTMIEYASVACPHCGRFNNEVFPAFKAKYIDTGQVFYIAREALTGDPAVAAAGFLTARCAGKDKYFQVTDAIYHAQVQIETGGQARQVLETIARSAGLTDAQFAACITDEKAQAALNARWDRYMNVDKVDSTPTFVINGQTYSGEMGMPQLDAAVAKARSAKPAT